MTNQDDNPPARPGAGAHSPQRPRGQPRRPRLDPSAQTQLGRSLRLYYASLTAQPLPARFTRLVEQLSDTSTRRGA